MTPQEKRELKTKLTDRLMRSREPLDVTRRAMELILEQLNLKPLLAFAALKFEFEEPFIASELFRSDEPRSSALPTLSSGDAWRRTDASGDVEYGNIGVIVAVHIEEWSNRPISQNEVSIRYAIERALELILAFTLDLTTTQEMFAQNATVMKFGNKTFGDIFEEACL
jgi:hypothetical protein